jgi:multimeric flavodoxin WrbA
MIRVAELGLVGWTSDVKCQDDVSHHIQDGFGPVSQQILAADVVVVASPRYFGNVPAQLKALIDLSQCHWIRKYVDKEPLPSSAEGHDTRRGVFIAVGGQDYNDFEGTVQTITRFFDVYEVDYWGELLFSGVDARDEIKDEPLALQEAHDLGYRAVAEAWQQSAETESDVASGQVWQEESDCRSGKNKRGEAARRRTL